MSSPTPSDCPTGWTSSDYCTCPAVAPSSCVLWGIPYPWLIISFLLWIIAALSGRIVDLLVAILGLIFKSYKRQNWTTIVKKTMMYWSTMLLRWGLIWAGVKTLQLPANVYQVIRYFFSIPFFLILFPWVNVAFDCVTLILSDQIERSAQQLKSKSDGTRSDMADGHSSSQIDEEDEDFEISNAKGEESELLRKDEGKRTIDDASLVKVHAVAEFLRVLKYLSFIFLFILALQSNNVPVVSFFKSGTLLTLSIVFAAQPWIRNLVGGLLVFFDNKYTLNDHVRIIGAEGQVKGITLRTTMLQRDDNAIVYVPNSRVLEQPVTNLSRRNLRLLEVRVQLSRLTKAAQIRNLITELEHSLRMLHPSLIAHPANKVKSKGVGSAGEFFVVLENMFEILVWTYTSGAEKEDRAFSEIQSEVLLSVKEVMEKLKIQPASKDEEWERENRPPISDQMPEYRSRENLVDEGGRPFVYTNFDQDDYLNDDIDYSMGSAAMLYNTQ